VNYLTVYSHYKNGALFNKTNEISGSIKQTHILILSIPKFLAAVYILVLHFQGQTNLVCGKMRKSSSVTVGHITLYSQ